MCFFILLRKPLAIATIFYKMHRNIRIFFTVLSYSILPAKKPSNFKQCLKALLKSNTDRHYFYIVVHIKSAKSCVFILK